MKETLKKSYKTTGRKFVLVLPLIILGLTTNISIANTNKKFSAYLGYGFTGSNHNYIDTGNIGSIGFGLDYVPFSVNDFTFGISLNEWFSYSSGNWQENLFASVDLGYRISLENHIFEPLVGPQYVFMNVRWKKRQSDFGGQRMRYVAFGWKFGLRYTYKRLLLQALSSPIQFVSVSSGVWF